MRLYDLTNQQLQLLQMIEDGIDVLDTLEANQEAINEKAEGYAKIIKMVEGHVATHKEEIKRLQGNVQSFENNIKRLKENVFQSMNDLGVKKIDGTLFKFSIAKNPPSLEVLNDSEIPRGYFITPEPVMDKAAIKEELKLGHEIPGVQLKVGESLRIR
ncbi:MAG: siphovirus Gp157 family protein [Planococcaceae bacterium]|nr:siphovirus Gp157 family protein [Planococcaceae bacterium]